MRGKQAGPAEQQNDRHQHVDRHTDQGGGGVGLNDQRNEHAAQRVEDADHQRATSAPRTEPMPPITTTTSARMRMGSPAPGSTDNSGPIMMPASAASMALSAKISV